MKNKKFQYSVALSFSGKQRSYVERVSKELTRLNVRHFYDYNEQETLWGKDLARYLDKLYYEDAEYFVPFISKEYVETVWPNHELSAALDRNMNDLRPDFQRYILPVYFEDIRVNGIPRSLGYYDANSISPEMLAKAIYKKLNPLDITTPEDKSFEEIPNSLDTTTEIFSTRRTLIETINSTYVDKILSSCDKESSHIIVVYGERGLGKRCCIYRVLSEIKSKAIYHIKPFYENRYKYDSIIQSIGLESTSWGHENDLDFESNVKRKIISLFTESPSIVYIEHFHEFDKESRKLIYDLATSMVVRYTQKNVCFVFEFDSDTADNLIEVFYELVPSQTKLIEFNRLPNDEITECFYNYCENIKISEKNLNYIIRSSLGNIMYLNVIVNYLKGAGYICEVDGQMTCTSLPDGALSNVLKKYLLQRYERLDIILKDILSKSSVIGNVFNVDLLEKPFQIIDAAEKLYNIEKISNLIENCNNQTYIFETEDVYNLIQSKISNEQQYEWHSVLAHYFLRVLNREKKRMKLLTTEKIISLEYPIAKHFKYATKYKDALPHYLQLISLYSKICDYTNELEIIKDLRLILNQIEMNEDELDKIETELTIYMADCYTGLGKYQEAHELYEEVLSFFDNTVYSKMLIDVYYKKSYCLYMIGKIIEAQETLNFLCEQFNLLEKHKKDYIRIISLLASICDSTNDTVTQRKLYLESLTYYRENSCDFEYYEMLKMSSMVFDEEIALEMELSAIEFFQKNQSIRNLAETLHNLATTELYLLKTENINDHLNESISLLDTFGSKAVHYPLNTKGITQMVVEKNYDEAISTFLSALSSSTEVYSDIAIRTNLIQCFIQLKKYDEALEQILLVDSLIKSEPPGIVPVYETYHLLNWACFYLHRNEYEKCETYLHKLLNQTNIENRHKYLVKSFRYIIKKKQGAKTRNTAGTSPYPIYYDCINDGLFFATLRFFE